jgi:hypothetical protein
MALGVEQLHLAIPVSSKLHSFFSSGIQAFRHPGTKELSHSPPRIPRIPACPTFVNSWLPPFVSFFTLYCSFSHLLSPFSTNSILYPFYSVGVSMSNLECDGLSVTHASNRTGSPDLRLIHFNDVYHIEYDRSRLSLFAQACNLANQSFVGPAQPSPLVVPPVSSLS